MRGIQISRRWVTGVALTVLLTGSYGLWRMVQAPPSIESQTQAALELARRQSRSGSMAIYDLLENLDMRFFKRETQRQDPGELLEALGPKSIPSLAKHLKSDPDLGVRELAARALGAYAVPEAFSPLTNALRTDAHPSLRATAAASLAGIQEAFPENALLAALDTETDQVVLMSIIDGLGQTGDKSAVPGLIKHMELGGRSAARAAEALGDLGDTNAVPALIAQVSSSDRAIRSAAVSALGKIGDTRATPLLIDSLDSDENADVRESAATGLGLLLDTNAVPALIAALQDGNQSVRTAAATSLGHLQSPNSVEALAHLLKDPSDNARFAAAFALAEIGDPRAIAPLEANLNQNGENSRLAIAAALTMMGGTNGFGTLAQRLKSNSEWQRFVCIIALARVNTPDTRDLLALGANDREPAVRNLATAALDGRPVSGLITILRGQNVSYRGYAAQALAFLNDPQALPALREAVGDRKANLRSTARFAVRKLEQTSKKQALK